MAINPLSNNRPCGYLYLCALPVVFFLLIVSCDNFSKKSDLYYDTFFQPFYALSQHSKRVEAKAIVDSFYRNTSSPSGYLKYKRFDFLAGYYYLEEKHDTAKMYIDSAIKTLEQYNLTQHYPEKYAAVLNAEGDYCYNDGEVDKAFDYYSRSRAISISLDNNTCSMGNQLYHLGMITYRQEKYKESADYFKQAFNSLNGCSEDSVNYYWLQEIISNTALAYTKLGRYDSAKFFYSKALQFIEQESPKYRYSQRQEIMAETATGVIFGNLAKVYLALNIKDTAEILLKKSIAINSRPRYEVRDAMFENMELAELYYATNRRNEAYEILRQLRLALDTFDNNSVELRWYKLISQYYTDNRHRDLASGYLLSYITLKDSIDNAAKGIKKTDYGQLLREKDTQYQLQLLRKDNKLKQLYLVITVGVSLIIIFIALFIFDYYRKSKKNVITLTSLNQRISEQKANLEKALSDLQTSNEDKDRILRVVAHDLRTPISAIVMIGNILNDEETDTEKKENLAMIINASQSMISLTEELLEFSDNTNKNSIKHEKETLDARDLTKQMVSLLQFKAEEKKQKINITLPGEALPVFVLKEKINRLLSNLITNAIKFSPEGADIDVWVMKKHKSALIQVRDSGIGIPEGIIDSIFDSFTAAKRYGTAGERSFGLGLSISKQIVEAHNGRIWVSSTEGKGSSFFVELPLV